MTKLSIKYNCFVSEDLFKEISSNNPRRYNNILDDSVLSTFPSTVDSILSDVNGWLKYGVTFHKSNDVDASNTLVTIILCTETYIIKKGMKGFSFYDPNIQTICINISNWMGNSEGSKNNWFVDINDYRTYVINHEMGHHISHLTGATHDPHYLHIKNNQDHTGKPCPIMVQQTRGYEFCKPYLPNKYPTTQDLHVVGLDNIIRVNSQSQSQSSLNTLLLGGDTVVNPFGKVYDTKNYELIGEVRSTRDPPTLYYFANMFGINSLKTVINIVVAIIFIIFAIVIIYRLITPPSNQPSNQSGNQSGNGMG